MSIGSVIQMSGMKFVKVTSNCLFVGLESYEGAKRAVIDYGATTSLVAPTLATGQVCSWEPSSDNVTSHSNIASPHSCTTLVYPPVTTTYKVTVTSGTTSSTYLYQVVVNSPSVTTYTINLGSTQTLTPPTIIPTQTCVWSPTTYLSSSTTCSPIATPTATGTTTYTVALSTGHQFSYLLVTNPTTFQTMSASYCNYMTPCTIGANCSTNGSTLTLTDSRDNKTYRVRKFADGHCWMIDNLAYGGSTDACTSKTSFSGSGSSTPTNTFGTGTYGDCRNNPSSTTYGYLYNWQAAMQQSLAYYNSSYTGSAGNNGAGICPAGWLLPPNAGDGSFYNLQTAYSSLSPGTSANFWANTNYWNGVYSGLSGSTGALSHQASYAYYWSSTQYDASIGYNLYFGTAGNVNPQDSRSKGYGFAVRCVF